MTNPPSIPFGYRKAPCECGELHENDQVTWGIDYLEIGTNAETGEKILIPYKFCKTCKDILMQELICFEPWRENE